MFNSIIFICYLLMAAYLLVMVVWRLFKEEDWKQQLNAMVVIVPLLLRVLLLK